MKLFNYLGVVVLLLTVNANAQWATPDENQPSCAASPSQLANQPETLARIDAIKSSDGKNGLEAAFGAWKYTSVFGKMTVSVSFDENGFYLQSDDDIIKAASICADEQSPGWVRLSVHSPACPENKNIYIKAMNVDEMGVKAFMSRSMGVVKFKKISAQPLPEGKPKPPVKCADLIEFDGFEFATSEY